MSRDIAPAISGPHVKVTKTSLEFGKDTTFDEWAGVWSQLRLMEGSLSWWIGDCLNFGEDRFGEEFAQVIDDKDYTNETIRRYKWIAKRFPAYRRRYKLPFSHYIEVASVEDDKKQDQILSQAEENNSSKRELRGFVRSTTKNKPLPLPSGQYHAIVADPPWPMEKISREVRPNQKEMDYPVMSVDEIADLPVGRLAGPDAHLYLWTTQRFLPDALRIAERWGFAYQCLMTWVKNVGFTPFSWMYSTEHVVFATKGNLPLERKGLRLDFTGKVREHSRKPDEFYDLVTAASPNPRVELFSRQERKGFTHYGDETGKFV